MHQIEEILENRIMFLDGAMGTMIQKHKLTEKEYRSERFENYEHPLKGNNDLLSITQPDIISEIHNQFLDAGADINLVKEILGHESLASTQEYTKVQLPKVQDAYRAAHPRAKK